MVTTYFAILIVATIVWLCGLGIFAVMGTGYYDDTTNEDMIFIARLFPLILVWPLTLILLITWACVCIGFLMVGNPHPIKTVKQWVPKY